MNNKKVLSLLALAILLVFGAFLFTTMRDSEPEPETQVVADAEPKIEPQPQQPQPATSEFKLKMADLFSSADDLYCIYQSTPDEPSQYTGEFYFTPSTKQFSVTFVVENERTIRMVSDGEYTYSWAENEPTGMKIKVPEETGYFTDPENSPLPEGAQDFNVDCKKWNVDDSKFELPSTVTFTEISVPSVPNTPAGGTIPGDASTNCSICEQLTGDDKVQCLEVLNC